MPSEIDSPSVLKAIRAAVQRVEQSSGIAPDDPAIFGFKQNVVRTVGELKVAKAKRAAAPGSRMAADEGEEDAAQ
jgi:hypothetical protein